MSNENQGIQGLSLVDEGDNHFLLRNGDGQEAPLPKSGLSDEYQNQIRSLPKALDPRIVQALAEPSPIHPTSAGSEDFQMPQMNTPPLATSPIMPPQPMAQQPMDQPDAIQPPGALHPIIAESLAQSGQPKPQDPNAGLNGAFGEYRKGIQMEAQGKQDLAKAQETITQEYVKQQDTAQKAYADTRANLDVQGDALRKDVMDSKIDPNHFWASKTGAGGFASKVSAFLGLFLGGMSQMKTGVNPAQAALDNMIKRDIDAQTENLSTKKGLLRDNMDRYNNLQQAHTATEIDMRNMFAAQLQLAASQTASPAIKGQALKELGIWDLKTAELKNQMAQHAALNAVQNQLAAGGGLNDQTIASLPKEVQELAVKVKNPLNENDQGRWMKAKTPEAAKEVEKIQGSVKSIVGLIDSMKAARARNKGDLLGATSVIPYTNKSEEYNQLHGAALDELRSLSQGARLNEGTMKYLSEIIPAPGSFKTSDEELDRAKDIMVSKLNNEIQGRIFNAPSITPLKNKAQDLKP